MATVTVKFFATVREITGMRSMEMDAKNVRELLDKLKQQFGKPFIDVVIDPKTDELKKFFSCMVNGKRIELLNSYETELADNDAVALFPPVGGG